MFLLGNSYTNTSVQKSRIGGMPGCLEHIGMIMQVLREAKEKKGNLAILWVDLAKVYGSIPHKIVNKALRRYNVPRKISDLIFNYYYNF